ncbi:no mechanoreceptor potential C [Carabus blaptoides fortunei]
MELEEKVLFRACTREKDLQKLLLEAIREGDVEKLEDLLEEDRIDVNYVYNGDEELSYMDKTALQIASAYCKNDTNALKCIKMLLKYGADVLYEQHGTRKTAVHFAAESGNEEILKILLQHLIGTQHLHDEKLSNLFFTLIKYIRDNGKVENEYKNVFTLLLENDIEINVPVSLSGWTAIYTAAKYNFKAIIELLLDKKREEINLDDFKDRKGKSARNLILENKLYNSVLPEFIDENSNITVHTLYKNIRQHQTSEFCENFERIHNNLHADNRYTLLYMAVDRNSRDLVEYLLDRGINCNDFDVENNPLLLACKRGYHKIIRLFRIQNPNSKLVSKCLMEVTKAPYTNLKITTT